MHILLIEDELSLAEFIQQTLTGAKHKVTHVPHFEELEPSEDLKVYDLIILDLMLNGNGQKNGHDLLKIIQNNHIRIPVLVLSALSQIETKIKVIKAGADDYMTKPFHADELLARIEAIHRRYVDTGFEDEEAYGDLKFYWKQKKIQRGDQEIHLTKKESALLKLLFVNRGKVVSTEDILKNIWHSKLGYHSNVIQATIKRLRKKLDNDFDHKLIRNVHGIGYILELPKN